MLKIVYPICCGLDIHKNFVYVCIADNESGVNAYKSYRFSTFLKLDSVFTDVFGKASSNIIGHIPANPSGKISNVSAFKTKSNCCLYFENLLPPFFLKFSSIGYLLYFTAVL